MVSFHSRGGLHAFLHRGVHRRRGPRASGVASQVVTADTAQGTGKEALTQRGTTIQDNVRRNTPRSATNTRQKQGQHRFRPMPPTHVQRRLPPGAPRPGRWHPPTAPPPPPLQKTYGWQSATAQASRGHPPPLRAPPPPWRPPWPRRGWPPPLCRPTGASSSWTMSRRRPRRPCGASRPWRGGSVAPPTAREGPGNSTKRAGFCLVDVAEQKTREKKTEGRSKGEGWGGWGIPYTRFTAGTETRGSRRCPESCGSDRWNPTTVESDQAAASEAATKGAPPPPPKRPRASVRVS